MTRSTPLAITVCACAGIGSAAASGQVPERPADVDAVIADVSPERIRATIDKLVSFGTRHTLSNQDDPARGIGAASRWLRDELADYARAAGRDDIVVEIMSHTQPPSNRVAHETQILNVVMTIPGSMPEARDRRFVVLGHYDSRNASTNDAEGDAPGANDDGSGTALTVELARVMASRKPEATIVFLLTAGEEQGLYGAQWFARTAVDQNWRIDAALSNDIVGDPYDQAGNIDRSRIRVFSEGVPRHAEPRQLQRIASLAMENDSPSRQLARYVHETAQRHHTAVQPWLIFRPDRFLRGGDHNAFNEHGFAAVRFTEVEENFDRQHQNVTMRDGRPYGDVPEFVDPEYLAGVTQLNGATLWSLANAPSAPRRARLVTRGLTHTTTIQWEPSPEPDVAGYEILWRDTTSALWNEAIDVGNVTSHTIDRSKDNYFFGVRAYDRDGHRSLVSFPGTGAGRE